jgi:hypothetical protein
MLDIRTRVRTGVNRNVIASLCANTDSIIGYSQAFVTIDALTGGRLELGPGAGHLKWELDELA